MAAFLAAGLLAVSVQARPVPPANSSNIARSTSTTLSIQTEELITRLRKSGRLNDGAPMFDLGDPRLRRIYDEVVEKHAPCAIHRDTTSWDEIDEAVTAHLKKHGPGALIVICGASSHIYGAIPRLEKTVGIRYVSATPFKLSVADIRSDPIRAHRPISTVLEDIKAQMERMTGVVKKIGYDDVSAFLADRAKVRDFRNVVVGIEETGLHDLYNRGEMEDKAAVYEILLGFVGRAKPTSLLFIGENLDVAQKRAVYQEAGMKKFLEEERRDEKDLGLRRRPWDAFLIAAKSEGIPVDFGAFGHRDHERAAPRVLSSSREE